MELVEAQVQVTCRAMHYLGEASEAWVRGKLAAVGGLSPGYDEARLQFRIMDRGDVSVTAESLGIDSQVVSMLRYYFALPERHESSHQDAKRRKARFEQEVAERSDAQIARARRGESRYPEFDEAQLLVKRDEINPRSRISLGHLRYVIATAREALSLIPDVSSDVDLDRDVRVVVETNTLRVARQRLGFEDKDPGPHDLWYLRLYLDQIEVGEARAARDWVSREIKDPRDFSEWRRAGD